MELLKQIIELQAISSAQKLHMGKLIDGQICHIKLEISL